MNKIKSITMIVIIIVTITISFKSKYDSLISEFESIGKSKKAAIDDHIQLSNSFIENVTIYGNSFFGLGKTKDSAMFHFLKYDPISNSYSLDNLEGMEYGQSMGNLIGMGIIPYDSIKKEEFNLVFQYNQFFNKLYDRLPDVEWLYYTSESNFMYMYPWISSKEFPFTESLKSAEFYELVTPENNPLRKAMWTQVYLDHAGKGLMVTLSSPIYDNEVFKGVVSLDLTNKKLSQIIDSQYETYLIDGIDSIIATNQKVNNDKIAKLESYIGVLGISIKEMKELKDGSAQMVGKYYVYKDNFNDAPWNLILIVPAYSIVGEAAIFTLPIFLICVLLLFALREVEVRKKTEEMLKTMAITDQLTGLNNRHYFDEKALEEMYRSDRYFRPLSMIIFDLDYFKHINDTWGHPIGDEILKQTAELMRGLIRKTDTIFRVGGEEFVVLMPETNIKDAMEVAEKLREAIENNIHYVAGKLTASFGVGERERNESFESWYKRVDEAMYDAKDKGRNCVISS